MKYQIADAFIGTFGDVYESYEEAEKALIHEIEDCQKFDEQWAQWEPGDESHFAIVQVKEDQAQGMKLSAWVLEKLEKLEPKSAKNDVWEEFVKGLKK